MLENEGIFYHDQQGNLAGTNDLRWVDKSNRKRGRSCSVEAIPQASGEATKSASEIMPLKDSVNCLPMYSTVDDEREWKKIRSNEAYTSSSLGEKAPTARSSSKVHPLVARFFGDQLEVSIDGVCVEAGMPAHSVEQKEKLFFPVEPRPIQNIQSDNLVHILSSDDEGDPEAYAPNLELALGGRWKAQKKSQEDYGDVSASLSLSLAVPTPKKEQPAPILKPEQHLQEMPDLNAPLLLFRDFPDT